MQSRCHVLLLRRKAVRSAAQLRSARKGGMDTDAPMLATSRAALTSSSSGTPSPPSLLASDAGKKPIFMLELIKFGDNEAEIKWVVKNFSRLEDEEVESEPFILGGIKWRVIMFPKGNFKKEKKKALYFALYLGIDDFEQLDRRLDVKLTLSVVNQKYSNKCSGESQHVFSPGDEDSDWGFTQFMKLGELQNTAKGWIVDDCIWVEADIKLLNVDMPELKSMWTKMMPLEELLSDMRRLRSVGAFHDVHFVAEKKRLPAHKAIINARCAELGKLIEDKPEVEIKAIRHGVLEQILDYVYFDTIEFDADRILEVATKAQEFKLFRLGCICENLINQNLSVDNVLILLMSSEEQHSPSVKQLCLLFIRDHYVDVVSKSGALQGISKKHPQLMVEIAQAPTLLIAEDGELRPKPPSVSPSTISTDLGLMLQSKAFADITFVIDNETIRAHKAIISNRCEFFSRMFQGGMLEHSSSQITLDMSPAAFKLVLRYLYTNSVSLSVASLDDVFNLLDLSERFLLKRLKNVCESILKKVLDIDNVVEILKYCGIYDLPDLKQTCLQMISKYRVLLCTKEHLSALEPSILVDLAVMLAKPDLQSQPGSS